MNLPPGQLAKRALLFVGLLFLVLILAFAYEWQRRYQWATAALDEITPRHARLAGLAQSEATILTLLSERDQRLGSFAFPNTLSTDRVGTELQQRIRRLAETTGLHVIGTQLLPPRAEGTLERISLSVNFQGSLGQIGQLLAGLEAEPPRILTDNLNLTHNPGQAPATVAAQTLSMTATFSVLRIP